MARFQVLEIVRIGDHPHLAGQGLTRLLGCITEIREYSGPAFPYSVRGLSPPMTTKSAVCMTSRTWSPPARGASADLFALLGGLRRGEVIRVAAGCDVPEAAGQTGIIDGTYRPEGGLGTWIDDLGDSSIVAPRFVTSLSRRLPREPLPRPGIPLASTPAARSPGTRPTGSSATYGPVVSNSRSQSRHHSAAATSRSCMNVVRLPGRIRMRMSA